MGLSQVKLLPLCPGLLVAARGSSTSSPSVGRHCSKNNLGCYAGRLKRVADFLKPAGKCSSMGFFLKVLYFLKGNYSSFRDAWVHSHSISFLTCGSFKGAWLQLFSSSQWHHPLFSLHFGAFLQPSSILLPLLASISCFYNLSQGSCMNSLILLYPGSVVDTFKMYPSTSPIGAHQVSLSSFSHSSCRMPSGTLHVSWQELVWDWRFLKCPSQNILPDDVVFSFTVVLFN